MKVSERKTSQITRAAAAAARVRLVRPRGEERHSGPDRRRPKAGQGRRKLGRPARGRTCTARIGRGSIEAVTVLRKVVEEETPSTAISMGSLWRHPGLGNAAVVALFHLAPDGKELAETWAGRLRSLTRRAYMLGAMGKPSFEADAITRIRLEASEQAMSASQHVADDDTLYLEGYIESLARYGVGGRLGDPASRRTPQTPESLDSTVGWRDACQDQEVGCEAVKPDDPERPLMDVVDAQPAKIVGA